MRGYTMRWFTVNKGGGGSCKGVTYQEDRRWRCIMKGCVE